MMQSLRQMVTCHWSARRIQRYLDADPSAPLSPGEVATLEGHLAVCEKCARATEQHRALRRALARWTGTTAPDPEALRRLRTYAGHLAEDEPR